MRGAENIISVFGSLVSQMTPVITITANVADGDNWKLSTCNTYWATTGMVISIDGEDYRIESFVKDNYIIVSGLTQPVVTSFQLDAPEFWHGSRRKVNNERSEQIDVTRWVAYLPIPRVTENNDEEIDFVYEADLRPLFVFAYDEQLDTIDDQQTNVIEPANAMADFYLYLINDQEENFNTPEDIERYEWMNFGDETIWGKDKLIFDAPLSGVELRHNLQIMPDGVCQCEDVTPITCMPAQIYINGVYEDEAPSGQDFLLIVEDTNGDPQGVYDEPTKKLVVPAGTTPSIDVSVNGDLIFPGQSTNLDIQVVDSSLGQIGTWNGTEFEIADGSIVMKNAQNDTLTTYTNKAEEIKVVTLPIIYIRPPKSFYNITWATGDEYWIELNDPDPYTPPTVGVPALLDPSNPHKLLNKNAFGHYWRRTGVDGGYYDIDTAQYKLANGTVSDVATTFGTGADGYFIDHHTGLGWKYTGNTATIFTTMVTNIQGQTCAGFSDFQLCSMDQFLSLWIKTQNNFLFTDTNYAPLVLNQSQRTCTPLPSGAGAIHRGYTGGNTGNAATGTNYGGFSVRRHYT